MPNSRLHVWRELYTNSTNSIKFNFSLQHSPYILMNKNDSNLTQILILCGKFSVTCQWKLFSQTHSAVKTLSFVFIFYDSCITERLLFILLEPHFLLHSLLSKYSWRCGSFDRWEWTGCLCLSCTSTWGLVTLLSQSCVAFPLIFRKQP